MSKKSLAARRAKNVELTKQDRANRCDYCKRELKAHALRFDGGAKFCDFECKEAFLEARTFTRFGGR